MEPEQLRGRSSEVDARSDVYALGVLLYRLLTERLPFDVSGMPWPEAIQRVLEAEPMPIGNVNPALGGPLEHIVARAMARDAGSRYQTAAGLAADLQRFLEGRTPDATAPASSPPECIAAALASGALVLLDVETGLRSAAAVRCGCGRCRA